MVVKVVMKKTFIQIPITVEEPVKKINVEDKMPEPEEREPRIESTGGVRLAGATPQPTEGTNSVDGEKQKEDWSYTFGKQEPIGELFQKVLDTIASYRQEKADQAYYQAYRARMGEFSEEAAEAACQSPLPTQEAEENP